MREAADLARNRSSWRRLAASSSSTDGREERKQYLISVSINEVLFCVYHFLAWQQQ